MDSRIIIRTASNFNKSKYADLESPTNADYSDIKAAVVTAGYEGSMWDLEKAALNYVSENTTTEQLIAAFANAAKKAVDKTREADMKAKEVEPRSRPSDGRILYPLAIAPDKGNMIRVGGRQAVITGYGKQFPIRDDHPSLHGEHLLGFEGSYGAYAYYRFTEDG